MHPLGKWAQEKLTQLGEAVSYTNFTLTFNIYDWNYMSSVSQMLETRNSNADVRFMLDNYEWVILPVLNVDGYEYTHTGVCKHNNDAQPIRKIIFYHVIQINQSLKKMMKEKSNRHLGCKTTHMVGWLCHVVLNTLLWLVVNHMSPIYYSYQSLRKSMLPTPYNFSSPQANYFLSTIRLLVIDQIVGSTRRSREWH